MASKGRAIRPRKIVDEEFLLGNGRKMREEVWQDSSGAVVRYNLAFIDPAIYPGDNGRVLGYDSAHGFHHRHFMGRVEEISFPGYEALSERFFTEVRVLISGT